MTLTELNEQLIAVAATVGEHAVIDCPFEIVAVTNDRGRARMILRQKSDGPLILTNEYLRTLTEGINSARSAMKGSAAVIVDLHDKGVQV
jgi:hypothetical protein